MGQPVVNFVYPFLRTPILKFDRSVCLDTTVNCDLGRSGRVWVRAATPHDVIRAVSAAGVVSDPEMTAMALIGLLAARAATGRVRRRQPYSCRRRTQSQAT